MPEDYTFHPEALAEYVAAMSYYLEEASATVAQGFIDEMEVAVRAISASPQLWRKVDTVETRRYLMHRFPYALYYHWEKSNSRVTIYAVMHLSRKPGYWHGRLGS